VRNHRAIVYVCILLVEAWLFAGCKSAQVNTAQPEANGKVLIGFQRTACFGQCPIYGISIYENGMVLYEGVRYVEKTGTYCGTISKKQLAEMIAAFDNAHVFEMQDRYPASTDRPPVDLPSRIITYQKGTQTKRIVDKGIEVPPALIQLETMVDNTVKNLNLHNCDK